VSIFHALILGIVQGLSEYLPISSAGHLILVPWLFGWDDLADNDSLKKAFDVAVHLGTLLGAIIYFRHDIVRLTRAAVLTPENADGRLAWYVALSAVPAAIVGALFSTQLEGNSDQIWLIAVLLIVGALGLAWADGALGKRTLDEITLRDAVYIGIGQAFALQPGLSRTGITITIGRAVGMGRDAATRFAFLMSLPIILAALVYKYVDIGGWDGIPSDMRPAFVVGVLASTVTGYLAVAGLIRLVQNRSFLPFVLYRLLLGFFVLGLLGMGFGS
jgi:undecaprenyl-diphosphatase